MSALDKARNDQLDPKLDLVRYAVLYQQAGKAEKDSLQLVPLFALYRLNPTQEISKELVLKFARLAEYYLLKKGNLKRFETLYADYQVLFADNLLSLQQLKEIYFIEMAQYSAMHSELNYLIMYLDSLDTYRPGDPQIQKILTPLLLQSIKRPADPGKAMEIMELYSKDFPFLLNNPNFKDIELNYQAERIRLAFDAGNEIQAKQYLEDFEKLMARSGFTPRIKLWITTAYYSASSYYFRNRDYPNARWHVWRALKSNSRRSVFYPPARSTE